MSKDGTITFWETSKIGLTVPLVFPIRTGRKPFGELDDNYIS